VTIDIFDEFVFVHISRSGKRTNDWALKKDVLEAVESWKLSYNRRIMWKPAPCLEKDLRTLPEEWDQGRENEDDLERRGRIMLKHGPD